VPLLDPAVERLMPAPGEGQKMVDQQYRRQDPRGVDRLPAFLIPRSTARDAASGDWERQGAGLPLAARENLLSRSMPQPTPAGKSDVQTKRSNTAVWKQKATLPATASQ
jgi:hypothetical protein